jgi:hypothetical protein
MSKQIQAISIRPGVYKMNDCVHKIKSVEQINTQYTRIRFETPLTRGVFVVPNNKSLELVKESV